MTVLINGNTGIDTIQDGTVTRAKTSGLTDLLQMVSYQTGAVATGTTLIPADDTIPQNTEGNEYMTLAITPISTSSILEIDVIVNMANSAGASGVRNSVALFQDSTANALNANAVFKNDINSTQVVLKHLMSAGTTSLTTFKVRAGSNIAGTTTLNGTGGTRLFGGVNISSITIKEWLA